MNKLQYEINQSNAATKINQPATQQTVAFPTTTTSTTNFDFLFDTGLETSTAMAKMMKIGETDQNRMAELQQDFLQRQMDPTSIYYNPYIKSTNQHVDYLASLGIDTSKIDDDFFNNNAYLMNYYKLSGTTNNPSSPGKKATTAEKAAYAFYQVWQANNDTKKAKEESQKLQWELTYKAIGDPRNMSNQQIIDSIDWSNYSTLQKMKDTAGKGAPMELNEGVAMATADWMNAVIWAARNDGGTGSVWKDMAMNVSGVGNLWKEDTSIEQKLDFNNQETYAPYSVGMTIYDDGMYFGTTGFNDNIINKLRTEIDQNDPEAMKHFQSVLKAEERTKSAEEELKKIEDGIISRIVKGRSEENILKYIDSALEESPTLTAMDESLVSGKLLDTTRAVNYRKQDLIQWAKDAVAIAKSGEYTIDDTLDAYNDIGNTGTTSTTVTTSTTGTGGATVPGTGTTTAGKPKVKTAEDLLNEADQKKLDKLTGTVDAVGTDAEKAAFDAGHNARLDETSTAAANAPLASRDDVMKRYAADLETQSINAFSSIRFVNQYEAQQQLLESKRAELENAKKNILEIESKSEGENGIPGADIDWLKQAVADPQWEEAKQYILSDNWADQVKGYGYLYNFVGSFGSEETNDTTAYRPFEGSFANVGFGKEEEVKNSDWFKKLEKMADLAINGDLDSIRSEDTITVGQEGELQEWYATSDRLENEILNLEYELQQGESKYNEAAATIKNLNNFIADASDVFDDLSFGSGTLQRLQTAYTASQSYNSYDAGTISVWEYYEKEGKPKEEINKEVAKSISGYRQAISDIQWALDNKDKLGYSDTEVRNLEQNLNVARVGLREAFYYRQRDNADFDTVAQAEMEKCSGYDLKKPELANDGYSNLTNWNIKYLLGQDVVIRSTVNPVGQERANTNGQADFTSQFFTDENDFLFDEAVRAGLIVQMQSEFNKDDIEQYFYLLSTDGEEAANGYFAHLVNDQYGIVHNRENQYLKDTIQSWTQSGGFLGALGYTASFGYNLIGGVQSLVARLKAGSNVPNQNGLAYLATDLKSAAREGVHERMVDLFGEKNTEVANFFVDAVTSNIDSKLNAVITQGVFGLAGEIFGKVAEHVPWLDKVMTTLNEIASGNSVLGKALNLGKNAVSDWLHAVPMAIIAAEDAYHSAIARNATPEQAQAMARVTFLAESLTEAITYSNISGMWERGASGETKGVIAELLKDHFEEAIGEGINEYWESNADTLIMDNLSSYKQKVEELVAQGIPRTEAEKQATDEVTKDVLKAAASGFVSSQIGTVTAYVGSYVRGARYNNAVKNYQQNILTRLNLTEEHGNVSNTVAISSSIRGGDNSVETGFEANAAAKSLVSMLSNGHGSEAIRVLKGIVGTVKAQEVIGATEAVRYAALTDGEANTNLQDIIEKVKNGEKVTEQDVHFLMEAAQNDKNGTNAEALKTTLNANVRESRIADATTALMARLGTDIEKAEETRDAKMEAGKAAQQALKDAQNVRQAKADAVTDAANKAQQAPTDESYKQVKSTLADLDTAITLEKQAEQHAEKAQQEVEKAQDDLNALRNRTMSETRQQAEQMVDAQDQVIQQAKEQAAQQAIEQAQQQAQMQAEEDERTGKAQETRENSVIDQIVASEKKEGVEAENRAQELKEQRDKVKIKLRDLKNPVSNAEGLLALGELERRIGMKINLEDMGPVTKDGWTRGKYSFNKDTGEASITINKNMTLGQALVEAALHEITHSIRNTNSYKTYRDVVLQSVFKKTGTTRELYDTDEGFRAKVDYTIAERKAAGDPNFVGKSLDEQIAAAEDEIVADFARLNLAEKDVVQRFVDSGLGGKIRNALHNINQALKNYMSNMSEEEYKQAEYFRRAERAFQKAMDEASKNAEHPEGEQFSIMQIAQATGLNFDEKTLDLYSVDENGNRVNITEVTPKMIQNTPVGKLIDKGLVGEQNQKAKEMMAGLMSMVAKYKNSDLVWEIGATTLSSTFSALKSNSDPQYKTTVDFGTVCAKTQAIIDTLSQVMLDKVKNGEYGGLNRKDIMKVYDAVNKAGLSVPCPVCYVFSRWMGVPSLLGQMSQYQHDYVVTDENGKIDKNATQEKVDAYIQYAESEYGNAKAINNKKTQLQNKRTSLEEQRVELEAKSRDKSLTEAEKTEIQNKLDSVLDQMVELDNEIGKVSAYNWITQALCKKDKNGKYVVDEKFQLTPDEILFDLNRTGEFAGYEKNWKYRNTRGAGMGKAIMPYSGETIGDILYGVKKNGRQSAIKNPWLNMDDKAAAKQLKEAQNRAIKQNLVGGQRLQSTSDFRPEWGLDYIMSFLELQAAGSKVQMYTKVAEAVDFFASVGADVNLSIMGKGQGWHVDENGNYVLDFSNITGMDYDTAKELKNKYNNVQMILVGMNDTHIRLAMANSDIDFIIPWHSSGNSKDVLAGLIAAVGEKLDSSVDYTTTQTDMVKGTVKKYTDENGNKVVYSVPGEQTAEQKALWDARMKLLTKGGEKLTEAERVTLLSNPITADLYKRFTEKGVDNECYRVKLSKEQASQIFPYEYWDTSLTKDQADENGKRFVEYCEAMGIVPRFSQFKDDPGYWKLLIDRPMYNNDGTYHQQQVIDVTNARIGDLNEAGQLENSDLPTQAQAKYAPKDPRNPNYAKYTEAQKQAVMNAEAMISDRYDDGSEGSYSVYGDMSEADRAMMYADNRNAIYVKDGVMKDTGETVDFIDLMLDGKKTGETRTHNRLTTNQWVGLSKDGYVYGRVKFGKPYQITKDSPEYKTSYIEGVKDYDIEDNGSKWYYPIEAMEDFRDNPLPILQNGNYGKYSDGGEMSDTDRAMLSGKELSAEDVERIEKSANDAMNSTFAQEYDNWDKTSTGKTFDLGKPHSSLVTFGLPDVVVRVSGEKLNALEKNHHGMSGTVIKQIPNIIKDPIIIMPSSTVPGRITAFGEVMNDDGHPVLAALSTTVQKDMAENVEFVIMNSAYGKDYLLQNFLNKADQIVIVDKNRADAWAGSLRVEFPSTSTMISSDGEIVPLEQENVNSNDDLVVYDEKAYLKDTTIDRWLKDYAASNPDYAQAYIAYINPDVFLDLTTVKMDSRRRIIDESSPLNEENMQAISPESPMFLRIDGKTGEIYGHEGRHRAVALSKAGIQEVPVLIFDYDSKYSKTHLDSLLIRGQSFDDGAKNRNKTTLYDVTPLSTGNRNAIVDKFTADQSTIENANDDGLRVLQYSNSGEQSDADREMLNLQTLKNGGVLTQEDIDAYQQKTSRPLEGRSTKWTQEEGPAQRQFGGDNGMLQQSELVEKAKAYAKANNAYFPDTNADQIERAINWIRGNKLSADSDGYSESLQKVTGKHFDYRSADGQARMVAMMAMAVARNDIPAQVQLADAFNRQGTDLGRSLQSRKLFRMMTPTGRIATIQKMLQDTQNDINSKGTNITLSFSDWIYQAAAVATEEGDFAKVQQAAAQELAAQLPANWKDKVRGIRMLSMLGNPRTHIRNIIGNALFVPAVGLKNKLGAIAELGLEKGQRTKTLAPILNKAVRDFARQDAIAMKDTLTGEAKYNENNMVQQEQKAFSGLLQAVIDFNSDMLEKEDWTFLKGHYRRALGGWMQANGYTAEQLQNDAALLEQGRAYAVQEAQKATYRDFNKLAQTLNKVSRDGGVSGFLVDAVLPFKKTPANILRRGIEYSPVGLMKSLTADLYHLKQYNDYQNGKLNAMPEKAITPSQFIDHLCSGLAGSAILAVGALLSSAGIVTCGLDDDKDKLEKEKGNQEYAFKVSILGHDVTFTMDWAAPMSMPFFVGAAIEKQLSNQGEFDVNELVNAFGNITEPVFNLSMLDGVNTLFKTAQSNGDDKNTTLTQIGAKVVSNYVTSYVPSLLGAVARTIDDSRRKAYVEIGKGTGVTGTFRYAIEQTENKIPGLSQTNIPYRNVWGEAETSGLAERVLENFILPGYINEYKNDPILNEMGRLYDSTGDASMIPSDPNKSVTYKKEKYVLTAEQWDRYKEVRGQTAFNLLSSLIETEDYKTADDATQVQMIKNAWSYADSVGKSEIIPNFELDETGGNAGTIAKDAKVSSYKTEMIKALNLGDWTAYDTMVEALRDAGVEDTDIKTKISNTYRDLYKDAYRNGDEDKMAEIEDILDNTGFHFKTYDWEKQVDKE